MHYRATTPTYTKCTSESFGNCYLREFIFDFAGILAPLYALSKGKTKPSDIIDWADEHEKAFTELKERLCTAPALGLPNPSKPFHIQVDAHEKTLSGILAQKHGEKLRL